MIAVVDYATGNLRSVADALRRAGAEFTLTAEEFRKYLTKDPAFERRFQTIDVEEPSVEDTTR